MKQLTGNQIRKMFLDYFASKGHMVEPGASLVPHNDPTLLWINSGVAALKKYFDGSEKPKCNRITNAQKSIRTNDIENVGKTARHHTFFEMLGNFSIGDYFKPEAIHFAWEFLTDEQWMAIPKEKLYISVYTDDQVAYDVWTKECGVDPSHILKTDDNFWEIGEGPGGPDSEIFFDRGEAFDPQGLGEKLFFEELENDRYIEVWNVVFSQYDCKPELPRSAYKELPQKNIDTGMGLERLTCLVQGGETNFDTDLFLPIIHATERFSNITYAQDKMAYRVIADHIRTVTFALADGALFSNEGRGYVLRRVLRRAVRFGRRLQIKGAFMYQLVPVVYEIMKDFYPYIGEKIEYIQKLVKAEEERFHATLADGEKLLSEVMGQAKDHRIDGATAFKLYDTYGFPMELTLEIAEENGFTVDKEGFDKEMAKQREMAKNAREEVQSMASQSKDLMDFTDESTYEGYEQFACEAKVIALFQNGAKVDALTDEGDVILDHTVCYAESGGQIADSGVMENDHFHAVINDVKKAPHKQHLHHIQVEKGTLRVGDAIHVAIDETKRKLTTANHSCTHLLQSALKAVVGTHIQQAGSYVCDEYLRFDFTHFEKVKEEQLEEIEKLVNRFILEHHAVSVSYLPIEEAKKTEATALFDEKYGDIVRIVTMGDVSKEFCGGCHVSNTADIGICKIVSEESIGSGIRRITAKTGYHAYEEYHAMEHAMKRMSAQLKLNSINKLEDKVAQMAEEISQLKKDNAALHASINAAGAKALAAEMVEVNGLHVLVKEVRGIDNLKDLAASLKDQKANSIVFLAQANGDKVIFAAAADQGALASGVHCGNLVKEAAVICDGNGGGRPDLAQAGGKNAGALAQALQVIQNKLGLPL